MDGGGRTWHCWVPQFPSCWSSALVLSKGVRGWRRTDLPLLAASVSPVPEFSLGPPCPQQRRELQGPSPAEPLRSRQHTSPGAEPWQGEGAAYAEQMESIKTKGSRPASIYYPSKGLNASTGISSQMEKGNPEGLPRRAGTGRASRAQGARTRVDMPLATHPPCSAPGCSTEPSPAVSAAPPALSQFFSALHRTPSPFLGSPPVPGHPPVRDDATEQPGHLEQSGGRGAQCWQPQQHHLHGHCRHSGSRVQDPAAGSSPRRRAN